jgi:hypothetical protein
MVSYFGPSFPLSWASSKSSRARAESCRTGWSLSVSVLGRSSLDRAVKIVGLFYAMTDERFSFLWLRVPKVANSRRRSIRIGGLLRKQCLIVLVVNVI